MKITDKVLLMRDAGAVKRSHTCRTLLERNVAEHSHGVAMLVLLLYAEEGILPRPEVLAAALTHDLSELATGDMPAPVKRENPALRQALHDISHRWEEKHGIWYTLTAEEQHLLLWCDRMDFALYSLEEVTMGNRYFSEFLGRILHWLDELQLPGPPVSKLRFAAHDLLTEITMRAATTEFQL
jgi:5'-deoxynucleotidase